MKLMFKYGVIIVIIASCFHLSSCGGRPRDYEKIADEITARTASRLEKETNLRLIGTGGGMMHNIYIMAMSFQYYQEVDLKTARELATYAVHEYLKAINSNEEVRPFLRNYPFTAKNIKIRIWVFKPDRSLPALDKIHYISAMNGNIKYYLDLPETFSCKVIHKETYEEALQLVSIQKSNVQKKENETDI